MEDSSYIGKSHLKILKLLPHGYGMLSYHPVTSVEPTLVQPSVGAVREPMERQDSASSSSLVRFHTDFVREYATFDTLLIREAR